MKSLARRGTPLGKLLHSRDRKEEVVVQTGIPTSVCLRDLQLQKFLGMQILKVFDRKGRLLIVL